MTRPIGLLSVLIFGLAVGACAPGLEPLAPKSRPPLTTDEAGFWLTADRQEHDLQAAPHRVRDPALQHYVQGVACKVAGAFCGDIRVYLVRGPGLNASMRANGAMTLQTGLLVRLADEAQLAAVIGHELGHYIDRHGFAQAERSRRIGDIGAWASVFGAALGVPDVGSVLRTEAVLDRLAFSRDQERAADVFGLERMSAAGYDPAAAAEVWDMVLAEAEEAGETLADRLLATHPAPQERQEQLRQAAAIQAAAGQTSTPDWRGRATYRAALAPHRRAFLADEVRLRQPTATLALFRYLAERDGLDATLAFYWGEVYRLRGWKDDRRKALTAYARALAFPDAPAETHRSIGLVRRALGQRRGARFAFERYLTRAPDAPDRAIVQAYIAGVL